MNEFLLGSALGFLFVGCIAAPFVAPWRIRVRYIVNAQVADPIFGFGPPRDVDLREVLLTNVEARDGHVDLVVEEAGTPPGSRCRAFTRDACRPALVAQLDGWSATHAPLLMVVDESGDVHLYGPDGAVTFLNRAEEKTR
jgi:hypothetical protein